MDSSSPLQKNIPLQRIKVAVFLFAVIFALGVIAFTYFRTLYQAPVSTIEPSPVVVATGETTVTPEKKTDFGTAVPDDFPTNIPLEAGVMLDQSYRLDYPDQKQLTAVFVSKETMKKNYDMYSDFLKKEKWSIRNAYESEGISSLYAMKENSEINITLSGSASDGAGKSQVSISVLKK